jgi:REP element-mobilizing transposase RayT
MATKKRITIPGAIAHVMGRGIDGQRIFSDDQSRRCFLDLLAEGLNRCGCRCYAWSLMDNHFHLVIRCGELSLDSLMRPLLSRYARYFNRLVGRRGYLYGDRYRSIVSQDQGYLEELIRYVNLNPLRAGIVTDLQGLAAYEWCGHGVIMGVRACEFQDTQPVLRRFGSTAAKARTAYLRFLEEGLEPGDEDRLIALVRESNRGLVKDDRPECWVIGDRDFVLNAMSKNRSRLALRRTALEQWSLASVCARVAEQRGVTVDAIRRRERKSKGSKARKEFCYIACRLLQFPVVQVAQFLGCSPPAVSWSAREGEQQVSPNVRANWANFPPG